jgi:gamma-glutamyltranspeptidase/glutathione hydrolase
MFSGSPRRAQLLLPGLAAAALVVAGLQAPSAQATKPPPQRSAASERAQAAPGKQATAVGKGGAVSSVDPYASRVGLKVLKQGGNAVDAAVATAAALGVTEPYSSGIGGGGYFVYYDAKTREVHTIDGRETAPAGITPTSFLDPKTGKPYSFAELVTSGVSVGVPGTPATWDSALEQWGSLTLGEALAPASKLARKGFVVDETFRDQTKDNEERFKTFTSTRSLYLNGGLPKVGAKLANPDLAATYDLLGTQGIGAFYGGPLAAEIANTVQHPPVSGQTDLPVPPGSMTTADLAAYKALDQKPTRVTYRGNSIYGMAPSSSGGSTVGEALNILKKMNLRKQTPVQAQHRLIDATHLAFADRGQYVGDPAFTDVPLKDLLSSAWATERGCKISATKALKVPTKPGAVNGYDGVCHRASTKEPTHDVSDTENVSTTNLTVTDKKGNVVEYTLTIERTGGSAIVVPGRGFILNNELTDFSIEYDEKDPNRVQPGKRPRSSMSPTIVLDKQDKPLLALGSPGGSTIITTVLQILVNRFDLGMSIEEALAAPRAAPDNTTPVLAEPAYLKRWRTALGALGHKLKAIGDPGTRAAEIGAATAIEFGPGGLLTVVAEPKRRGGGAAAVVKPAPDAGE